MFGRWWYKIWYAILFYWKALEKAILGFAVWYSEVLMADERSISFVLKFLELHSSSSRTPFHGVLGDSIDIPSHSSQWKTIRAMYWDVPSYGHCTMDIGCPSWRSAWKTSHAVVSASCPTDLRRSWSFHGMIWIHGKFIPSTSIHHIT